MSDLIVNYASVMRAEISRLGEVAQNVANANTPGYLERNTAISGAQFLGLLKGETSEAVEIGEKRSTAAVTYTEIFTDLALANDGWFVVLNGNQALLTRNGKFRLESDGSLRTADGYAVIGESGPLAGLAAGFGVTPDGSIFSESKQYVGKIKVVGLNPSANLASLGGGIYSATSVSDTEPIVEDIGFKVVQGALNTSNVDVGDNMVSVMEITRHIESLQRAMSTYNDILNAGINELGK